MSRRTRRVVFGLTAVAAWTLATVAMILAGLESDFGRSIALAWLVGIPSVIAGAWSSIEAAA